MQILASLRPKLEALLARQDEEIAALEATTKTQAENQLIQIKPINDPEKLQKIATVQR